MTHPDAAAHSAVAKAQSQRVTVKLPSKLFSVLQHFVSQHDILNTELP